MAGRARQRFRSLRLTVAVVLAVGLLPGCVSSDLAFRVDDRLTITSPEDRATVGLPVRIAWKVEDFTIAERGSATSGSGDSGYFGVFVDRAPQPPGRTLEWTARKDRSCRPADGCPDAQYLAARGIYSTTQTEIVFPQLPRPSDDDRKERHTVTVVLLDTQGKRIGESAFQVDFVVQRGASS